MMPRARSWARFSLVLTCAAVAAGTPAAAGFSAAQLAAVSAAPPPGAALPLALGFRDEAGHPETLGAALGGIPAVVVFADYTCHTLCGPILEFAAAGLAKSGLRPGTDYRLVAIGLDPKDGLDAAREMKSSHIAPGDPVARAAIFLSGRASEIAAATAAVGLRYAYDPEHDQFAHPAAAYVIDGGGRVRRMLSGLGLDGGDLRLALVDAGQGAVGTFADQIRLLCYGYDPVRGIYTERITALLEIAAATTVLAMAGAMLLMFARERRRAAS